MTTAQEPRNYPFSAASGLHLDPTFAHLRATEPVSRVRLPYGGDAWLVTSHEDIKTVFTDPRFSRFEAFGKECPRPNPEVRTGPPTIIDLDPPHHTRLRKLVNKAFTARQTELLRPRVEQVVTELLDRMEEKGSPADLLESLAYPLPMTVICELLGVPLEDRDKFHEWSDAMVAITSVSPQESEQAFADVMAYIANLVEQRRRTPSDDMLGMLVAARDEGDKLSEEELVLFGVTLLIGGYETTANQIGNFAYTLFTHPDQLNRLLADPGILDTAIEELSRYCPLLSEAGNVPRIAMADLELGGVRIRKGDAVFIELNSANRDDKVFPQADQLDLGRTHNPHFGFGHGAHHCVGAQLAKVEMRAAIGALTSRFPKIRLAVPAQDVPWKDERRLRGAFALPVEW
ncbi:cytochrome P450 [Lentzea sp. NPDC059081]|uniref:cytochrome P450 n=1 Tax=Lentzea sp. NPDC059081 TaxID=3346719 RepID=UPI0036BD6469